MEALHAFVNDLASRDPASSGFIGPLPITSRFLGDAIDVHGGDSIDKIYPIMVRCVWPPDTQSRHAVIHMKLPVSEEALASRFYQSFDIKATKGIIFNTIPVFISEENSPAATTGLPTVNNNPGNQDSSPHFVETLKLLGTTKCGILDLVVVAEEQIALCHDCDHKRIVDTATLRRAHERCINVGWRCCECFERLGRLWEIDVLSLPRTGKARTSRE